MNTKIRVLRWLAEHDEEVSRVARKALLLTLAEDDEDDGDGVVVAPVFYPWWPYGSGALAPYYWNNPVCTSGSVTAGIAGGGSTTVGLAIGNARKQQ